MVAIFEPGATLQMINSKESKAISEWEQLYPDRWLFIEVTREDEWEIYEGKLIATAEDSIEFLELGKSYDERNIVSLVTRGNYTKPQPALVV
ncbi:MAG: hypothetical protein V7641_1075 [Blastocatellia bacterium]